MNKLVSTVPLVGAVFLAVFMTSMTAEAASCCGGGSAAALLLPKYGKAEISVNTSFEQYDGFWDGTGVWTPDPAGSNLSQSRMTVGGAYRLGDRWQLAASLPFVWNNNRYTGLTSLTSGFGDAAVTLRYETFDGIKCVWNVDTWEDLIPAIYLSSTVTVPTGISPYDDVKNNFDITGRGFYRADANILIDKTIYPWNMSVSMTYGTHIERPINREYGTYIKPYRKQLGDRASVAGNVGYTYFTDSMQSWTTTFTYADLREDQAVIDGQKDTTSGLRKRSLSMALAWSSSDRDWIINTSWNHSIQLDSWGRNFPTTDIISLGVSYVFR
ncbi:MAG: hypothetical protein Q9M20_02000 [Mariprofundaceae bacterium]|nr:hypothetical protein [Mariprofundaceae bacterium]